MTQQEIDQSLALMDQMEPLQMTEEEIAAWEADRKEGSTGMGEGALR